MKKQTPQQRNEIKNLLKEQYGENSRLFKTIVIIDDTTRFLEKETETMFTCIELQLKGALIEHGIRRRYVGHAEFELYDITN